MPLPEPDAAAGDEAPPWLAAAAAEGLLAPGAGGAAPPWLAAAAECGVVFLDPEGQALEVPSSQVSAFEAGLERIRNFEREWAELAEPAPRSGPRIMAALGSGSAASRRAAGGDRRVAAVEEAIGCSAKADEAPAAVPLASGGGQPEASQRDDVKVFVQKRYFALLRQGVDPNEAAAKAIREAAAGLPVAAAAAEAEECSGPPSGRSSASGSQKSCASSVQGGSQSGSAIRVAA